jgi:hypothetical protein
VSTTAQVAAAVRPATQANREIWVRRILLSFVLLASAALLGNLVVMLWAQNEFAQPESIVAAQSLMLAHDGSLYYDLNRFPYTVCAYTPIFYCLEAALTRCGLPVFTAGRLISFLAFAGILVLIWKVLLLYTRDALYAWTGCALAGSTAVLLNWGTVAQVDTLALLFALAAFYQYSRYELRGENTLMWAAAFSVAAIFTKQTMIACPAAIFILLWLKNRRNALLFGGGFASVVVLLGFGMNEITHGRFLANTVFANLNPFAIEKLNQHLRYLLIMAGQLIVVVAAGSSKAVRGRAGGLFVYLAMAALLLAVTAPKIGSDSNYQMESTVLLILCACVGLHALDFFPACLRGRKTWITLLQLPLAIHVVLNLRIAEHNLETRVLHEQQFRSQLEALNRSIGSQGRVLSADVDAMVHLRGWLEVEPLIYKLLVAAGRVVPEPLRQELAEGRFAAVVLYEDVGQATRDRDLEMPTLPDAQIAEIREHYTLAEHIPGPYLHGVYVYKPLALLTDN